MGGLGGWGMVGRWWVVEWGVGGGGGGGMMGEESDGVVGGCGCVVGGEVGVGGG